MKANQGECIFENNKISVLAYVKFPKILDLFFKIVNEDGEQNTGSSFSNIS